MFNYEGDTIITGSKDNSCKIWRDINTYELNGQKKPTTASTQVSGKAKINLQPKPKSK